MQTLAREDIEKAWLECLKAPATDAKQWMEELMQEQPAIDAYLFSADEHFCPSDERGVVFLLGFFIYKMYIDRHQDLKPVDFTDLKEAEINNIQKLYELAEGAHFHFDEAMAKLEPNYRQMPLLNWLKEHLSSIHPGSDRWPDANFRLAVVHLKTVMDCLDQ